MAFWHGRQGRGRPGAGLYKSKNPRAAVTERGSGPGQARFTVVSPGASLTDTARRLYDMVHHKYLTKKEAQSILLTE